MKKIMIAIVSMLLVTGVSLADETENAASEAKYYDNAKVIRIKNVEGEGFVQRSYDEGYEEATPNLPLFEKDTLGTTAGRMGIYLGRLNYLRLDSETTVELLSIPELRKTDLNIRVEKGAIYLDIESMDNEKSIQIQTPDCGIFLLDKGVYRINVDENLGTEVYVLEGIAEVAGQEDSLNVRENQKIVMSRGSLEERPYDFYASEKDDFDRWHETQNHEQGYARLGTSRYLQNGYEDYEYEMSRAGRWSYMSDFNSYVWTPYYSNAEWMPYANGRWVYNPHYGYVWTSYDNCGWFTHHYGRWHWNYSSGWYWIPGYHWSPAWVSWFGDNDYYGWCPLSWWNRPVVVINNRWDHNYNYRRGIPHHSRSTIIIRKNELSAVNARRVALRRNGLGSGSNRVIAYRGASPNERLAITKVTVINANGKAMAYKQNGIGSSEKYKISRDAGQVNHGGAVKAAVYKYNSPRDANTKYFPRTTRARSENKAIETGSSKYFRSKTSGEPTANTRVRSSDSNSRDQSQTKVSTRSNSTSSVKSSSSSSSSSSTRAAKKKKDQAAYTALMQSENSAGYKSHAVGQDSYQSRYAASNSGADRDSTHAYESRASRKPGSSAAYSNRYANGGEPAPANTGSYFKGYSSRSESSATRTAVRERTPVQNFSTLSQRNQTVRSSRSSQSYTSGTPSRAYTATGRSSQASHSDHSSRASVSAAPRSSGSSTATRSSSSSTVTRSARKKN